MLSMKFTWIKTNKRKMAVSLILLAFFILGSIVAISLTPTGYILFVYVRDNATKTLHINEITSGYRSLQDCKKAELTVSENGKLITFSRCATGCPADAETERDCKQHD
jgi:hypothetical protein